MLNRLTLILAAVFLAILLINYQIMKMLDHPQETPGILTTIKRQPYKPAPAKAWKETAPEELEKYGMTVTTAATEPTTPEGWEMYLETNFKKFKVLEGETAKDALKTMETTPEDYKKKKAKLKEDAKTVQKRLDADPFNPVYQTQLQNIYKLQALGNILEKKGVVNEDAYISAVTTAAVNETAADAVAPSPDPAATPPVDFPYQPSP